MIALDIYVLRWWSGVANVITNLLNRDINVQVSLRSRRVLSSFGSHIIHHLFVVLIYQQIIDDFGELIYREVSSRNDHIIDSA